MTELEEIIQRMIDAGESEENIKIVIESYQANPVKTEAVATETAPVTAVNEAVDTDLASEDISLEQFEAMEVSEKKKLSYRNRQRLLRERDKLASFKNKPWGEQFALQVNSPNFEDLSTDQILKIKEKATKDLLSQKTDKDDFEITNEQIIVKAKDIFENKVLPNAYTDKKTLIERTFGTNPLTDFLGDL